jgi:hypothetical protein
MPEQGPIGNVEVRELPNSSLSNLAARAREAYGNKRTKDCLDLTRAILLIDPENPEAQLMRSAIRAEMHQHLENAQALLRSAQMKDSTEGGSQPESPVSSRFRVDDRSLTMRPVVAEVNLVSAISAVPLSSPTPTEEPPVAPASDSSIAAAIPTNKRRWLKRVALVVLLGLAVAGLSQGLRSKSNPARVQVMPILQAPGPGPTATRPDVPEALPAAVPPSVGQSSVTTKPVAPVTPVAPASADSPVALNASGTLAISSPTSVDIYMDDLYVGSAPVSLEISPGSHTLEYRHGNLRKTVTHVINSNETTRAMITFDVTLQINAKPWADVFLDGIDRKPLGQTPLGGVRVPIGAVLVFENPGFEAKKYRVTGSEASIQIVFP